MNFKLAFASMIWAVCLMGCEKDVEKIEPNETSNVVTTSPVVKNEILLKFLSITMSVPLEEISLSNDGTSFLTRGHVFSRAETEQLYLSANVYQATYEQ